MEKKSFFMRNESKSVPLDLFKQRSHTKKQCSTYEKYLFHSKIILHPTTTTHQPNNAVLIVSSKLSFSKPIFSFHNPNLLLSPAFSSALKIPH